MQNSIISEGKTTNEAIENGLKKLGVTKKDVDVKVLEEEKKSFFDILAPRVVKVELTLKGGKKEDPSVRTAGRAESTGNSGRSPGTGDRRKQKRFCQYYFNG